MPTTKMTKTAEAVAKAMADVERLQGALNEQRSEADGIAATVAAAQSDHDAARARHGEALARRALGDATDDDVAASKTALERAAKALAEATKRAAKADDHVLAADCLQSLLPAAHDTLAAAKAAHAKALADEAEQQLRDAAREYQESAIKTTSLLARVVGLQTHLTFDHGRPLGVIGINVSVELPSVGGGALPFNFREAVSRARAEAVAAYGVTQTGAGSWASSAASLQPAGRLRSAPRLNQ